MAEDGSSISISTSSLAELEYELDEIEEFLKSWSESIKQNKQKKN
jgi:hypothetical protein